MNRVAKNSVHKFPNIGGAIGHLALGSPTLNQCTTQVTHLLFLHICSGLGRELSTLFISGAALAKKKKNKKDVDDEAVEESDDGDEEGRELDYISDSSDR